MPAPSRSRSPRPAPPVDPLEQYPGYVLRRISAAAMAGLAGRLQPLALRPTEASVLLVIEANPGLTQSDIGRMLDIASANMAPLAGRLRKRGLTSSTRVDGRSQGVSLSATGRRLTRRVKTVMARHEAALMERIPASQRDTFVAALHALWKG